MIIEVHVTKSSHYILCGNINIHEMHCNNSDIQNYISKLCKCISNKCSPDHVSLLTPSTYH